MLHVVRNHVRRDVTTVAVHDEETTCLRVLGSRFWLEDGRQPFVGMAIRRPTAVASREAPIAGRVGRDPGRVGMLCLKDNQRRYRNTSGVYILYCRNPLLSPSDDLLTRLFAYTNQCS